MFLFCLVLAFWGDSGKKVSHHFHNNSKEMMSTERATPSIMVQLLGTKIEKLIKREMNENRSQNSKFENELKFTKSEEKPAKTPNTKSRATNATK